MSSNIKLKAALFDLDGVVFDTEPQYTIFWGEECRRYHPEEEGLEHRITGQTLVEIFDQHFCGELEKERVAITQRLNEYEAQMSLEYVKGFEAFIHSLRANGVKTAVVTSSNRQKMESVYRQHPEFKEIFDEILTSEDFSESKPSPDCYLKGAHRFGAEPRECAVFEDSFNGLKSGRASGAYVVGISTTNPASAIAALSDVVVSDFVSMDYHHLELLMQNRY